MSLLELRHIGPYLAFDEAQCRRVGKDLAETYQHARPFPHIVVDDFLDPVVLRDVLGGYPSQEGKIFFNRDQERLKFQYHPLECESQLVRNLLAELNGQAFLGFLEEMTGIEGLISDPYYSGGGLHETVKGGHLSVHADFNIHKKMKLERRLNLLVYLNDDWRPEYGGNLELWDREMKGCEVRVAPVLGRAVIFSTNLDSYHGHPDPLTCPPERSRRSIATYYYTSLEDGLAAVPSRTTTFQVRPGSADRTDWLVRRRHLVEDWVPPAVRRIFRGVRRRIVGRVAS
jgi:hypothetical protein